jgi:hypothetical protein
MVDSQQNLPVIASRVLVNQRVNFLPAYFGARLFMLGESLVYAWLDHLSADYNGGQWDFFELSNGGFYMAPAVPGPLRIEVHGNYYSGMVSADAAGVIATLFALGQLAAEVTAAEECDPLIDHYHQLLEFARSHAEGGAIFQAID